jgi:hypothetical protein
MCQVSSGELGMVDPCVDLCFDFVECALEGAPGSASKPALTTRFVDLRRSLVFERKPDSTPIEPEAGFFLKIL